MSVKPAAAAASPLLLGVSAGALHVALLLLNQGSAEPRWWLDADSGAGC